MKKIYVYIAALLTSGALTSCEDIFGDFLDKQPSNELTKDEVFSSWKNTEYYYYDIYNFLRNGQARIADSWMDAATDLAETSYSSGGVRLSFNIGNYYSYGGYNELQYTWTHYYMGIRKCNTLLAEIDNVPLSPDEQTDVALHTAKVNRMKAEARFFRAYFLWELTLRYGAVPVITTWLDASDDDMLASIKRPASEADCFEFILSELRSCSEYLDLDTDLANADYGRITRGINYALRSRILLYLASPRYADLNLATWDDAVLAAEEFKHGFEGRYGLMKSTDMSTVYQSVINTVVSESGDSYTNPEVIFWRNDAVGDWWAKESPVGYGGSGGLCPSQNLVDMYDMADGTAPFAAYDETGAPVYDENGVPTVNAASGYDDQNPYANRDPRFYQTVLYNGAIWWNQAIETYTGGKDNPSGNANVTPTGYYNRKYHDDSQTHYLNGGTMYRNWIFIRYAEILLNYAEAKNEVSGPCAEVFEALQSIRDRLGMTAKLSERADLQTQAGLRKFIHKERTIELAFEDHRAWDVRRWKVAEEALSRPIYGMQITRMEDGSFTYTRKVVQNRVFEERMYLYPIPEDEIWKTGWTNNAGW